MNASQAIEDKIRSNDKITCEIISELIISGVRDKMNASQAIEDKIRSNDKITCEIISELIISGVRDKMNVSSQRPPLLSSYSRSVSLR